MTIAEIKAAVDAGKTVHWSNKGYKVTNVGGDYLIVWIATGDCIGLTYRDGSTLNGKPGQFFIGD